MKILFFVPAFIMFGCHCSYSDLESKDEEVVPPFSEREGGEQPSSDTTSKQNNKFITIYDSGGNHISFFSDSYFLPKYNGYNQSDTFVVPDNGLIKVSAEPFREGKRFVIRHQASQLRLIEAEESPQKEGFYEASFQASKGDVLTFSSDLNNHLEISNLTIELKKLE